MMSSFIFSPDYHAQSSNHATVTEPDQYNAPAAKPANKWGKSVLLYLAANFAAEREG
jgi:hypothetical protein